MRRGVFERIVFAVVATGLAAVPLFAADPDIRGSYLLVKRVLPDGSEIKPPDIQGFLTYTDDYRNFNVSWAEPDGKRVSLALISKYRLSAKEYCETPLYWMQNNLGAAGVSYDIPAAKRECSAVTLREGQPEFAIKGEPVVERFAGKKFTATAAGQFVDHWERVD